ncbi:hypothetical protein [Ignatzschineria sp. LJL83]
MFKLSYVMLISLFLSLNIFANATETMKGTVIGRGSIIFQGEITKDACTPKVSQEITGRSQHSISSLYSECEMASTEHSSITPMILTAQTLTPIENKTSHSQLPYQFYLAEYK